MVRESNQGITLWPPNLSPKQSQLGCRDLASIRVSERTVPSIEIIIFVVIRQVLETEVRRTVPVIIVAVLHTGLLSHVVRSQWAEKYRASYLSP